MELYQLFGDLRFDDRFWRQRMAYETASASAPRSSSGGKKGKLVGFSVDFAENGGFIITCRHADPPRKRNEPYTYAEPEKYALSNKKEAQTYIEGLLDGKK